MNAIVPLNIAAIRVSPTDNSNVVKAFKGRVAHFDNMPYAGNPTTNPAGKNNTSTGDTIVQLLESNNSPLAPLYTGIHLHWELPDYFRKGVQTPGSNQIVFPQAPNRWLVVRYLSIYDTTSKSWGPVTNHSWVVESDYISMQQLTDSDGTIRPSVPVPLPVNPAYGSKNQPYRFMGRVVDAAQWPQTSADDKYLPDFNDETGKPCYLNSIGFLGPGFAAYYPDCCSVFGFMDRFLDNSTVFNALLNNTPIKFKAAYQITGWIANGNDPMDGLVQKVTDQYNAYVAQSQEQKTKVDKTPTDFFKALAKQQFKWVFSDAAVDAKMNGDTLVSLSLPAKTLCSGMMQELVWDMLVSPGSSGFLGSPETPTAPGVWKDPDVSIAVGNTSAEALSALLKVDNGNEDTDPDLLKNYEYLLDALQLGILKDLETQGNNIIALEETMHSSGFSREQGGLLWVVQQKPTEPDQRNLPVNPNNEINLPLPIAEQLHLLNQAQKDYDMGRSALQQMRSQLYMDWYRYIKMYAGNETSANVTTNTLTGFLTTGAQNELATVVKKGNDVGIVTYTVDTGGSGSITGINTPTSANTSAAWQLWNQFEQFQKIMAKHADWEVVAVSAPAFWMPADPVAVMEGNRLEPARRNGTSDLLPIRVSSELLTQLTVGYNGNNFTVQAAASPAIAPVNAQLPSTADFIALAGEACLLMPTLSPALANALQKVGGTGNPAGNANFLPTLINLQGGQSGLETGNPQAPFTGLYNAIRQATYKPTANPVQEATAPLAMSVSFSNANTNGWAPNAVQWTTQLQLPEFSNNRYDPFLPVNLVWDLTLDPLVKDQDPRNYNTGNVTGHFQLNEDAIDYVYETAQLPITTQNPLAYNSAVVMSKKATYSIVAQINNFINNYPSDEADGTLSDIATNYGNRKILAQTMSGLNVEQILNYYIPQIPVQNLTSSDLRDSVTTAIRNAATKANVGDNWYNNGFNAQAPIPTGTQALANFGPLRSGFVAVQSMEVVDVFGQRMQLLTKQNNPDGSMQIIPAMTLAPMPDDKANAGKLYLPPRILTPSRLWFRWLSAMHDNAVSGISSDFVEMNSHPATSPVCGWVLPNHLDNSLFFYNADGTPVGSFGVEHNNLQYRTRAGNLLNINDSLAKDIGDHLAPNPPVNQHLANFMWYIYNKSGQGKTNGDFLRDMMQAILNSEQFISPSNFAQDASLAVLMGRPLAITRAVVNMETAGNLLPLNQADVAATDPWPTSVNAGQVNYADRQTTGSANIGNVQFPLRLGDLSNIDDGLIGYLIEQAALDPYGTNDFFAPAANATDGHGVTPPPANNVQLTLNEAPTVFTFLMDPRAAVHATTGVLPVAELNIPESQYSNTLNNLQMTFFTMPVLQMRNRFVVPLPAQTGYVWRWINPGNQPQIPLASKAANSDANWDYSPQTLLEGWLNLVPDPNPAPSNT